MLRQREWEDGLLTTYRKFLETCEKELQDGTVLAPAALRCLCNLLKTKTQFNFTVNIMDALAQQLGRTTWDEVRVDPQRCSHARRHPVSASTRSSPSSRTTRRAQTRFISFVSSPSRSRRALSKSIRHFSPPSSISDYVTSSDPCERVLQASNASACRRSTCTRTRTAASARLCPRPD